MQQSATYLHRIIKSSGDVFARIYRSFLEPMKTVALSIAALLAVTAWCGLAAAQTAGIYAATPVISDIAIPGAAPTINAGFVNPWGVSGGNTLWINTNATGFSYLSSIAGVISATTKGVIPAAAGTGTGTPTGTVQNTTTGFVLSNGTKASFLFSTADGTISGWNSATAPGDVALIEVNNNAKNAVYTDMALVTNTSGTYLVVPNFGQSGDVEVYNSTFQPATLQGTFTDPNIPAGYAPYGIKAIGTQVFVTYMLRTASGTYQPKLGTNTGFVSVFDDNGNFIARAVTGGNLNAPWGVTIAPAGFGIYGGDLLIGNFGDGLITAYNPTTYAYLGTVADINGKAIAYPGLWEIFVPTATSPVPAPNSIYFTAGLDGETHGLFGYISSGATTSATPTFNLSASTQVASVAMGSSSGLTISVAPSNAFTGTVSLTCSGLPAGASCNFSNSQLTVLPTAPATTTLTLQTAAATGSYGYLKLDGPGSHRALGIVSAMLLPFGGLLALRRRRDLAGLRILGVLTILFASASLIAGCSYSPSGTPGTPAGTTNVTITATSGSVMQSTVVAVTVQ